MKHKHAIIPRRTGRPLSFDRELALKKAMLVFWKHGYETTSLADLTAAMGVTAPSIYAAFGDKKRLFLEAVSLYVGEPLQAVQIIKDAPDARTAVAALLTNSAIAYTGSATPDGCLLTSAVASCSAASGDVQVLIADIRGKITDCLADKIEAEKDPQSGTSSVNAQTFAGLIMTVIQGMAILARDGASRDELVAIADLAKATWPLSNSAQ